MKSEPVQPSGKTPEQEKAVDMLIERWEEYYKAYTSPYYTVTVKPDAMLGLRQCIDELRELKAGLRVAASSKEATQSPEELELIDFLSKFDCPCCGFPDCGHDHEAGVKALFQAEIERLKAICAAKPSAEATPSPATKPVSQACDEGRHSECSETFETCNCTCRGGHSTMHRYANFNFRPSPATKDHDKTVDLCTCSCHDEKERCEECCDGAGARSVVGAPQPNNLQEEIVAKLTRRSVFLRKCFGDTPATLACLAEELERQAKEIGDMDGR